MGRLGIGKFIEAERLQVHYVADIEAEDPVVIAEILHAKGAAGRDFELLFDLQLVHLLVSLERDLEPLLLCHPVLEEVAPLFEVQLAYRPKLLLDADELVHNVVRLVDLLLEDFYALGHVLTAAAIRGG